MSTHSARNFVQTQTVVD